MYKLMNNFFKFKFLGLNYNVGIFFEIIVVDSLYF